jgi:DNA-binding response OmpR family regulator
LPRHRGPEVPETSTEDHLGERGCCWSRGAIVRGLEILQSGDRIELLITDMGLRGLNGRQLADAARRNRPDLPVPFITGYAESATLANGFLEPGMQMITRSFALDSLATRIRAIFEER